jgi:hypothetical protein
MFGKLSWSADPVRPADPADHLDHPHPGDRRARPRHLEGLVALSVERVDHQRRPQAQIGIMYMLLGVVMLIRGFADAIMMRTQQAVAVGGSRAICRPSITTRSSRPTARS